MAYAENQLFSSASGKGSSLRCVPTSVQPKTFAGGTALIAPLTPVAYNTSTNLWVIWDQDGSNGTNVISGFVWPDGVQLVSGSEVLGQVVLGGRIHFDDIPVVTANYSAAQLKAAVQSSVRSLGFIIEGLENFR